MLNLIRSFLANERGNVAMLTALAILFLIGAAGAGIDLGREQLVKTKLQQASDAAALAGANMVAGTSDADRTAVALRYFNLNFPDTYLGLSRPTPSITFPGGAIRVSATRDVPTSFMKFLGTTLVASSAGSSVLFEQNAAQSYDVLLVVDNSGSMAFADIGNGGAYRIIPSGTLRTNAHNAAEDECVDWYTQAYRNLGYSNAQSAFFAQQECDDWTDGWRDKSAVPNPKGFGLVDATRLNAVRNAARTITTQLLSPNTASNRVGLVSWNDNLINSQALTSNFTTVANAIDSMYAFSSTNSTAGMNQANTLSAAFDNTHVKAVILLTDGKNTSGGAGCDGNNHCAATDTATNSVCTTLKNKGIIIYTIAFGADVANGGSDASFAQPFLSGCASVDGNGNPRFFIAPDSSVLQSTFSQILTSIQHLRISD